MANEFITLADYAQHAKAPEVKAFVDALLKAPNSLFDLIPFATAQGRTVRSQFWETPALPVVRNPGTANYSGVASVNVKDVTFSVRDIGRQIDVDKMDYLDKNVLRNPLDVEIDRTRRGMAYYFNTQLILGSQADANGFRGIADWLSGDGQADNLPSTQNIDRGSAPVWASSAATNAFLDDVETLIQMIDGEPSALLFNRKGLIAFTSTMRRQTNLLETVTDQFDRRIVKYRGIPLYDVGPKTGSWADSDFIIPYAGDVTDIYAVRFGPDHLYGFQLQALDVKTVGWTQEGTIFRVIVSWMPGVGWANPHSVARLQNVKFATA